ncbi:MAG: hypothetical protein AAF909_07820 [Pseudomonadota bacterium]
MHTQDDRIQATLPTGFVDAKNSTLLHHPLGDPTAGRAAAETETEVEVDLAGATETRF